MGIRGCNNRTGRDNRMSADRITSISPLTPRKSCMASDADRPRQSILRTCVGSAATLSLSGKSRPSAVSIVILRLSNSPTRQVKASRGDKCASVGKNRPRRARPAKSGSNAATPSASTHSCCSVRRAKRSNSLPSRLSANTNEPLRCTFTLCRCHHPAASWPSLTTGSSAASLSQKGASMPPAHHEQPCSAGRPYRSKTRKETPRSANSAARQSPATPPPTMVICGSVTRYLQNS